MNATLWAITWILIRVLLDISKNLVTEAIAAVGDAEKLKHPDGTEYSGTEKKDYVLDRIVKAAQAQDLTTPAKNVANFLVEAAVAYFKKMIAGDSK